MINDNAAVLDYVRNLNSKIGSGQNQSYTPFFLNWNMLTGRQGDMRFTQKGEMENFYNNRNWLASFNVMDKLRRVQSPSAVNPMSNMTTLGAGGSIQTQQQIPSPQALPQTQLTQQNFSQNVRQSPFFTKGGLMTGGARTNNFINPTRL